MVQVNDSLPKIVSIVHIMCPGARKSIKFSMIMQGHQYESIMLAKTGITNRKPKEEKIPSIYLENSLQVWNCDIEC